MRRQFIVLLYLFGSTLFEWSFRSAASQTDSYETFSQVAIEKYDYLELKRNRSSDFFEGLYKGIKAFKSEALRGSFIAFTGVEPRKPILLMEGASFVVNQDGITFTLIDGTTIPPLSTSGYEALKETLPDDKRYILDDKFFWLLQRNPALPLIASGLEKGKYKNFLHGGVFDTDAYYLNNLMGYMFWAAQKAEVDVGVLLPLVEIHFLTLEYPYFKDLENSASGIIHSFYKYELELTNKQYLMRSVLATPLENWISLEAIRRVENENIKHEYTGNATTSTTVALGRLPLPTPTAAEETPGTHALSIAHLISRDVMLFPPEIGDSALLYERMYKENLAEKSELRGMIKSLAEDHHNDILSSINHYHDEIFWEKSGFTSTLTLQSVSQLNTSCFLGIYAARIEALQHISASESYKYALQEVKSFFQQNSPDLTDAKLLEVFLVDQAFNNSLWATLRRRNPKLSKDMRTIENKIKKIEESYVSMAEQEAFLFRQLQRLDLDISTEAFSLFSVATARRLSDLIYAQFKPGDRNNSEYLKFTQGLAPFLRDMPALNMQWSNGGSLTRYGLDNYVVPDLMALNPENSPTLSAISSLWFEMVSNDDLNKWDFDFFVKFLSTGYNLSVGYSPASLHQEQLAFMPLVFKYQNGLKQVVSADGNNAPSVLHGLGRKDHRISSWPNARKSKISSHNSIDTSVVKNIFKGMTDKEIRDLISALSDNTGEISLSPRLVLLHHPQFILGQDKSIDMIFSFEGKEYIFPSINKHFRSLYSPAYITRISLPKDSDQYLVDALNKLVRKSHSLYGGYTPKEMTLPDPLQFFLGD